MAAVTDFRNTVHSLLDDPSEMRYTDDLIDQALRWTLIEFRGAKPDAEYDIQGLDGALATTLLEEHQMFVSIGAAGYCADPFDKQDGKSEYQFWRIFRFARVVR